MARFNSEWLNKPRRGDMDRRALEAIMRRRRQMLVHSYLYYGRDTNIIDDRTWTKWAQQLARLQQKYGWRINFYDRWFKDWNGSSGYHLPTNAGVDHNVVRVAERLLEYHQSGATELMTKADEKRMAQELEKFRKEWAEDKYDI
jgi:hypothetical protein